MKTFSTISTLLYFICVGHLNGQNAGLGQIITSNQYDPVYNPAPALFSGISRDFLPVSPTAGSLGIYGQIPVGNYTGTAEISIPLYEVKYKDLSVPISLNYHASGVKPELFPGPVGLGWTLTAGGPISRVIKGYPDMGDYPATEGPTYAISQRAADNWSNLEKLQNHLKYAELGFVNDNEPDEYYFNINGVSGKFYVDHTDTFRVQSTSGHSFQITMKYEQMRTVKFVTLPQFPGLHPNVPQYLYPYSNTINLRKLITGFTMIDETGIKYNFGGSEKSIEFSRPGLTGYPMRSESYITPTNWFLASIESPNGYKIEFIYAQQTSITRTYFSDVILYQLGNGGSLQYCANAKLPDYNKSTLINGCYLTQIDFPNGKIKLDNSLAINQLDYSFYFSYMNLPVDNFVDFKHYKDVAFANTEKVLDMGTDSLAPHRVDNIHIYDNANNEIKKIAFGYQYDPRRKYRQKLYRLKIEGQDTEIQQYSFTYNDFLNLPYYNARATDLYGYWNNKEQFSDVPPEKFVEHMRKSPDYLRELKKPEPYYAQAEILTDIIYPTGGYSSFEYEPHEYGCRYNGAYSDMEQNISGNKIAGGVRIKAIRNYDKNNSLLSEKRFHYVQDYLNGGNTSSGVLAYTPQFSELYQDKITDIRFNLVYFLRFTTNPIFPLCETRGNFVTYSEVTVEESGNGYSVYQYKNYDNGYGDHPLKGFVANRLENSTGGGVIDFRKNTEGISMAIERGQLTNLRIYDKNSTLKKEFINIYNDNPNRFDEHVRYLSYTPLSINMTGIRFHTVTAGLYYTYFPYLKEKKEIDYLNGQSITKTMSYEYDRKYNLLKCVQTTGNNQQIHKKIYQYPHENSSIPIYSQMVQKRLLNFPVKEVTQVDGEQVAVYHRYATGLARDNANLIVKESDASQFNEGPVYDDIFYKGYDATGNPSWTEYRTGEKNTFLWSYNKTYPVAFIVGADFNQVKDILGMSFIQNLENSASPSESDIQLIRSRLAGLNAQITTYVYRPLVGVTSITQPNGTRLTYTYDAFRRLLTVKDENGKTVEKHQ